jgi:hypothetical protein
MFAIHICEWLFWRREVVPVQHARRTDQQRFTVNNPSRVIPLIECAPIDQVAFDFKQPVGARKSSTGNGPLRERFAGDGWGKGHLLRLASAFRLGLVSAVRVDHNNCPYNST